MLTLEMKRFHSKARIGILGCGAIGSRIAKSSTKELKNLCDVTAIYDNDLKKSESLAEDLNNSDCLKNSFENLLNNCDLVVEAVNADKTCDLIRQILIAKKDVLVMSVGKILNSSSELLDIAHNNHSALLVPSGAIAGIDAIKSASLVSISKITLTTRKPPSGLGVNPYILQKGIDINSLQKETVIFDGSVDDAVQHFPRNINVAATLALASQAKSKINIRIICSPEYTTNSHEIEAVGDFGRIFTRTENVVCPDNPKSSYLAVLSGIQTLRQYCQKNYFGT